jgi:nitrite reductase/ring-hydroxylating ferredoxin subunit
VILLCSVDRLPDRRARGFTISDTSLFAVNFDGAIHAYINSCPHLGVELNWREDEFFDLDGELLQCATHGALFDASSGECLAGPCRGQRLRPLAVAIQGGNIYVQLPADMVEMRTSPN